MFNNNNCFVYKEQVEQEIGKGICSQMGGDKISSLQTSFTKIRQFFVLFKVFKLDQTQRPMDKTMHWDEL